MNWVLELWFHFQNLCESLSLFVLKLWQNGHNSLFSFLKQDNTFMFHAWPSFVLNRGKPCL